MKKLIAIFISIILSLSIIYTSNAASLEKKLYKATIITKNKIAEDYIKWELYNKKIAKIFAKFRLDRDKVGLNKLKVLVNKNITILNNKKSLSGNDRKKLNLFNNIYYRTLLLLDYNL